MLLLSTCFSPSQAVRLPYALSVSHNCSVESHKVVPINVAGSLTKSCRSGCERIPVVAKPPAKKGGLIDRSAALVGSQAHPLTLPKFRLGQTVEWSLRFLQVDRSRP